MQAVLELSPSEFGVTDEEWSRALSTWKNLIPLEVNRAWLVGGEVLRFLVRGAWGGDYDVFTTDFKGIRDRALAMGWSMPPDLARAGGHPGPSESGGTNRWTGTLRPGEGKLDIFDKGEGSEGIEACLRSFDLSISQFATDGETLLGTELAVVDALGRQFHQVGETMYAHRIQKYINRGFRKVA